MDGKPKCAVLACRWMHPECYLPRRMQPDDPSGNLGFLKASVDVSLRLRSSLFASCDGRGVMSSAMLQPM